ncbi:iron ABC transporter permease [Rhizobium sp. Leaf262]|uniref:ABC transporter permease n=1 Tax=Rhizobium sp. Leaf262 TaxID=1736312 RepID=UPI000AF03E52|nr:iron ABC transporter permease [Rhizobium sp. Leaf262]
MERIKHHRHGLQADLIQWAVIIITALLAVGPLIPIVIQAFVDGPLYGKDLHFTLQNVVDLFADREFPSVLANTLLFAALTTVISQAIGLVLAVLVGRTDLPGKRWLQVGTLAPLIVSSLVLAFGWSLAYGPAGFLTLFVQQWAGFAPWNLNSLLGMSLVAASTQAPLAFLYCLAATAKMDSRLEEAARACGAGPFAIFSRITIPLMMPSITYGLLLNFTASLDMFSIPFVFGEPAGIHLFMPWLYLNGLQTMRPSHGLVAAASLLLLAIVGLLILIQSRILRNDRRYITVGGKASHLKPFQLGYLRWPMAIIAWLYIVLFAVMPIGILFIRACTSFMTPLIPFWKLLTTENFAFVLQSDVFLTPIVNTIKISVFGGLIATLFVALVAIVARRSEFRFARTLETLAMIPRAIPGLIAGIGVFYAVIFFPPLGILSGSIWLLAIAYTSQIIPKTFGAIVPGLLQISGDLDASARASGAGWSTTTFRIVLPLLAPSLLVAFSLTFISFFKEYSIAIYLVTPATQVIGTNLLQSWLQGQIGQVAALATIQLVMTLMFMGIFRGILAIWNRRRNTISSNHREAEAAALASSAR